MDSNNQLDFLIAQVAELTIKINNLTVKKKEKNKNKKAKLLFYHDSKKNSEFQKNVLATYNLPIEYLNWRIIKKHSDNHWDNHLEDETKQYYLVKAMSDLT